MRVQNRDLRLIRWLNGFGYAGIEEVADWFGVVSVTALIRLNKLVESGLLQRDKVILGGKYYYRPAMRCVQFVISGLARFCTALRLSVWRRGWRGNTPIAVLSPKDGSGEPVALWVGCWGQGICQTASCGFLGLIKRSPLRWSYRQKQEAV